MRLSEMLALTWEDYCLSSLHVTKSLKQPPASAWGSSAIAEGQTVHLAPGLSPVLNVGKFARIYFGEESEKNFIKRRKREDYFGRCCNKNVVVYLHKRIFAKDDVGLNWPVTSEVASSSLVHPATKLLVTHILAYNPESVIRHMREAHKLGRRNKKSPTHQALPGGTRRLPRRNYCVV